MEVGDVQLRHLSAVLKAAQVGGSSKAEIWPAKAERSQVRAPITALDRRNQLWVVVGFFSPGHKRTPPPPLATHSKHIAEPAPTYHQHITNLQRLIANTWTTHQQSNVQTSSTLFFI